MCETRGSTVNPYDPACISLSAALDPCEDTDEQAFADIFSTPLNCDDPLYDRERHARQIDQFADELLDSARHAAARLLPVVRAQGRFCKAAVTLQAECRELCHQAHLLRKTARRMRELSNLRP